MNYDEALVIDQSMLIIYLSCCCVKCTVAHSRCRFELEHGGGSSSCLQCSVYYKISGAAQHHDWDVRALQCAQVVWAIMPLSKQPHPHLASTMTPLYWLCCNGDCDDNCLWLESCSIWCSQRSLFASVSALRWPQHCLTMMIINAIHSI